MTRYIGIAATAFVACWFSLSATASTINLSTDSGQMYVSENGIGSSAVSGAAMAGMSVDVTYVDGGSDSLTWAATSGSEGEAASSDFSLSAGWTPFYLTTSRMVSSMSLSVLGLDSVFDIYALSVVGAVDTPNSLRGVSFNVISGDQDGNIDVSFANQVLVRDHMIGNDLYTDMTVDFSRLDAGGFFGSMSFVTDLDQYAVSGDLSAYPEISSVPLPAGFPLLLCGLGLIGLLRRSKSS